MGSIHEYVEVKKIFVNIPRELRKEVRKYFFESQFHLSFFCNIKHPFFEGGLESDLIRQYVVYPQLHHK